MIGVVEPIHSPSSLKRISVSRWASVVVMMVETGRIALSIEVPEDRVEQSKGVGVRKWIMGMTEKRVWEWRTL